jgi:hypothetical protein
LERLLESSDAFSVPVSLAVIPSLAEPALFARLAAAPLVEVAVHGWSHANHEPPGRKSAEFGSARSSAEIEADLRNGFQLLLNQAGDRFVPMFVPPWNRITPAALPLLAPSGFSALSVFGPEQEVPLVASLNTHVDLIDWRGSRGGRPAGELVANIVRRLEAVQSDPARVMGLLTHHLVHDAAGWRFLDQLFSVTQGHPGSRWVSAARALSGH